MILYNVTVQVDPVIADEWKKWMMMEHIPAVMATGCFDSFEIFRIQQNDPTGVTFSIQYRCENEDILDRYQREHAPALQKDHAVRYEGQFVAFRTLLEKIA